MLVRAPLRAIHEGRVTPRGSVTVTTVGELVTIEIASHLGSMRIALMVDEALAVAKKLEEAARASK